VWFARDDVLELRVMAVGGALYLIAAIRATRTYSRFWRRTFQLSWELRQAKSLADTLARTDELTGINNRRAFTDLSHQALEHTQRYHRPLALVMFDIDRFKAINDAHGHAAGDRVLQAVGATIVRAARSPDIPGRLGGEEFAVLLPETDGAEALTFAERLRRDLSALAVAYNGATIRFSCSFGVAARGEHETLDALLMRADAAMYRAKGEGRNRVSSAREDATQSGA
jgi:diguanylate cyclase (GGDEF)-like protein